MSDEVSAPAAQPMEVDSTTASEKIDDTTTAADAVDEPKAAGEEDAGPAKEAADETTEKPDSEMKDAPDSAAAPTAAEGASQEDQPEQANEATEPTTDDVAAAATTPAKPTPNRKLSSARKSKSKEKKAGKAGKAAVLHADAKPGDHFFIKLKGFPQWPCIICDEDMLPHALLKSRPVSAARADGTYREDFAEGGKRTADRTFPIMYLATNEFGWVSNKDLIDLDPEKVKSQVTSKMRKDLVLAHTLAEEQHDLEYYKGVLQQFQDELLEKQKAAEEKAAAAATPKASKKAKTVVDEDVEMEDADNEPTTKKDKKRKNTDSSATAQRAESAKKPKIKLTHNSTPKANGAASKAGKAAGESKSAKKAKKPMEDSEERLQTPKEPEVSAEDRFERKQKEVLFLRHKLQKGLLLREQRPKEEEMGMMSDYLTKLEGFPDLETSIIRHTKINKVLKAMLKLDNIPREEEFEFKPRSQTLLDKWNKLLAAEEAAASAPAETTNGVNGHKTEAGAVKDESTSATNGAEKAGSGEAEAVKEQIKPEETQDEVKEEEKKTAEADAATSETKQVSKQEDVPAAEDKPKIEQDGDAATATATEA
ncbi:hypothetical protein BD289DRAFT_454464 [Coniella lustricola]|uniref:PWWP domain-containing protein n=1 Tax=Coniella lustricola TaxID=2025994 RepID=A0A2T3A3K8_9PEZI|nr:hypothetical protein BD289DRAFT_454464 [Coniella lustricola]